MKSHVNSTGTKKPQSKGITIQDRPRTLPFNYILHLLAYTRHADIYMYVCVYIICIYVTYTYVTYIHLGSIQPVKENLNLWHFDIFLNFYSKWLRVGHRTQHQVFLHAWSKILYHNEWAIFFHWTNYTTTGLNNQIIHSLSKYFLSTSFIKHYSRSCLGAQRGNSAL